MHKNSIHSDTHHYPPLLERRPTYAEVDLRAFRHNFQIVGELLPGVKVIAIVKADAYGHGLLPIAHYLEQFKADYLGVGFLEEGVALREDKVNLPILVLGGVAGFQIDHFLEYDLDLTASSHFILGEIDRRARRMNRQAKVHLKIDTGMNRIGVNYRRGMQFLEAAAKLPGIQAKSIYSHLASAEYDPDFTETQCRRLNEFRLSAEKIFRCKIPFHILNTAGIINHPHWAMDAVRPGLMLYGLNPDFSYLPKSRLQPVLSLKSEIVFIKRVQASEGISYGLTHTTSQETTIVTIPIGYGDGYPVRLSNKGQVLIKGKRFPIIGKVCMDQIMVDVGDERVRIGEEVTLIGKQDDDCITIEEICRLTNAIPYEIACGITSRVPRLFIGGDKFNS